MLVDKDRPSTWKKYFSGMCRGCLAGCCTMPVEVTGEDLVNLGLTTADELASSPKKVAKQLAQQKLVKNYRDSSGRFMLTQKSNDDCVFLDEKTRLCTVYDRRPQVCREFPKIGPRPGYCPNKPKNEKTLQSSSSQ
jgi:Fe-S-cluster containining protein